MTPTQRKAMEQALDFIRAVNAADNDSGFLNPNLCYSLYECETALVTALAEPAPEHVDDDLRDKLVAISAAIADQDDRAAQAMLREILSAPDAAPAREPAPVPLLTDEEIHNIYDELARREPYSVAVTRRNVAQAIEALVRQKAGL